MPASPLFSASSVIGTRPGTVGVRVSGCPGTAWVWRPAYRPGGSIRAGRSLALWVPASASSPAACAVAVARRWPGHTCHLRRSASGRSFLIVRGPSLFAVACWWSVALARVPGVRAAG